MTEPKNLKTSFLTLKEARKRFNSAAQLEWALRFGDLVAQGRWDDNPADDNPVRSKPSAFQDIPDTAWYDFVPDWNRSSLVDSNLELAWVNIRIPQESINSFLASLKEGTPKSGPGGRPPRSDWEKLYIAAALDAIEHRVPYDQTAWAQIFHDMKDFWRTEHPPHIREIVRRLKPIHDHLREKRERDAQREAEGVGET